MKLPPTHLFSRLTSYDKILLGKFYDDFCNNPWFDWATISYPITGGKPLLEIHSIENPKADFTLIKEFSMENKCEYSVLVNQTYEKIEIG